MSFLLLTFDLVVLIGCIMGLVYPSVNHRGDSNLKLIVTGRPIGANDLQSRHNQCVSF